VQAHNWYSVVMVSTVTEKIHHAIPVFFALAYC